MTSRLLEIRQSVRSCAWLGPQAEASQQRFEPRVRAKPVEARVGVDPDDPCGALLVGLLKPLEGLLFVLDAGIDVGEVEGGDIAQLTEFCHLSKHLLSFRAVPGGAVSMAE